MWVSEVFSEIICAFICNETLWVTLEKIFEKNSKNIFALEKKLSRPNMKKSKKFFWVKSAFNFSQLTDQRIVPQFWEKHQSVEKFFAVIFVVWSKKFVEEAFTNFKKKDEKRSRVTSNDLVCIRRQWLCVEGLVKW